MELVYKYYLLFFTLLLGIISEGILGEEYGSFHYSHPPFYYIRDRFSCKQSKRILWDSIALEVHPGVIEGCGILLPHSQAPQLWSGLDRCLNDQNADVIEGCRYDEEYGLAYQVNITQLQLNQNITFPCVETTNIPEIIAIHLIYKCNDGEGASIHPDDDIMTLAPRLPPIPPNSLKNTSLPPPPERPKPTMVVEPTDNHTPGNGHIIVSEATTSSSTHRDEGRGPPLKTNSETQSPTHRQSKDSSSHPITYNELAIIVGPSVAAIAVLILVLVVVILVVRRRSLKLPSDLQGESLFHSRRFSTASQLSDVSLNGGHQMRSVP